jgi:hypothetical protein
VHYYRIQEAYRHASTVLEVMKSKSLSGDALKTMKALEVAVQNLEYVMVVAKPS